MNIKANSPDQPPPGNASLAPVSRPVPLRSVRVIGALVLREMTTTFGKSQMGYLWVVLEPIGGIVILSICFSLMFHNPPLGESFLLFYATGYLPFLLYNNIHGKISSAIRQNKTLLFYPVVTFIDVIIARFILIFITEVAVWIIVFGAIMMAADTGASLRPSYLFIALICVIMFGLGVGLVNAALFEIFPAWQRVFLVLSRPMFFISGVFFILDSMPEAVRNILWWNPLLHAIGLVRKGFYYEYDGEYLSPLYVILIFMPMIAAGLALLRSVHREIINE